MSHMFERFTNRARMVVVAAQEEARLLGHAHIGTEHLLLGLMSGDGVAAKVLLSTGLTPEAVRGPIVDTLGWKPASGSTHIPFTPRAKKALELSLREALSLGHNYIGTEHILLGVMRVGEGKGAQILAGQGLDFGAIRALTMVEIGVDPGTAPPVNPGRLRGLRRRGTTEARPPSPSGRTPGQVEVINGALTFAAGRPMGTHHMLRALATLENTAARRALEECGIDCDALAAAATSVDVSGTTDSTMPAIEVEKGEGSITLRFDDPSITARLEELDDDELKATIAELLARRSRGEEG
jgi:hypothetical protein